jgi:TPR repeat protein
MLQISLQTAATLCELSTRTIRRRMASGLLKNADNPEDNYKTMINFESIQPDICMPLEPDDIDLIKSADSGDAGAQNDLALLFLENSQFKSAVYWLQLAAQQHVADAMQLLGEGYLKGYGVPKDNNLAIMWIAKAASLGHPIALAQMQSIRPPIRDKDN